MPPTESFEEDLAPESRMGVLRAAVERRFRAYAKEAHPGGITVVYAREAEKDRPLTVCVGALGGGKANFWQGHSCSEMGFEVGPDLQVAA